MADVSDPFVSSLVFDDSNGAALASAVIRAYCEWHIFPAAEDSVTLDVARGSRVLALPSLHVIDVSRVSELDNELAYRADYEWSEVGLLRRLGRDWVPGYRAVNVTFAHGYQLPPAELEPVTVALAKRLPASATAVQQEGAGSVSRSFAIAAASVLTPIERVVLDRYRLV